MQWAGEVAQWVRAVAVEKHKDLSSNPPCVKVERLAGTSVIRGSLWRNGSRKGRNLGSLRIS